MTTDNLWYTRRGGEIRGPFPARQVTRYILLGRIREDDELSQDRANWNPVHDCLDLIPEEMKSLKTEEDYQRLELARMREDERCASDRRDTTQRMDVPATECRRAGERRKPETDVMLRHRKVRNMVFQTPQTGVRNVSTGALIVLIVCVVAVILFFARFTPKDSGHVADCDAPAAPHVNWNNCRRPGLVADQIDDLLFFSQ